MKAALCLVPLLLAIGCGGSGSSQPPPGPRSTGLLVPLYTYPTDASWTTLAQEAKAHPLVPIVAIVNPASGPGAAQDPAYVSGIAALRAAGITVAGYVATNYGATAAATVDGQVDQWHAWYPQTQGIFFDEQAYTAGQESYYGARSAHAKSDGFTFALGNPGTDPAQSYLGTVDTMVIYENAGLPSVTSLGGWHDAHLKSNFAIICYGTAMDAAFVQQASSHVGLLYLTNGSGSNPYSALPPYLDPLLQALDR